MNLAPETQSQIINASRKLLSSFREVEVFYSKISHEIATRPGDNDYYIVPIVCQPRAGMTVREQVFAGLGKVTAFTPNIFLVVQGQIVFRCIVKKG